MGLATVMELVILVGALCYLMTTVLYHVMIHKVNRRLPSGEAIPQFLPYRGWSRLRIMYKQVYPDSHLYEATLAVGLLGFAVAVMFWWLVLRKLSGV